MEILYFSIILILCCIILFQEYKIKILESTIDEVVKTAKEGMTEIAEQGNKSMADLVKFASDNYKKKIGKIINGK